MNNRRFQKNLEDGLKRKFGDRKVSEWEIKRELEKLGKKELDEELKKTIRKNWNGFLN